MQLIYSAGSGTGPNSTKVEPKQIQLRLLLLQRYLDHQAELELQALYALQALVHKFNRTSTRYVLVVLPSELSLTCLSSDIIKTAV